ncbi:MAG: CvpA family protein [Clostridiales bacterium]|nr:CvpA family protein [Clostridiales bacterium]
MNYIDLAIVIFAVICIYFGVKRGFILSLIGMLRATFGIPLSFYIGETYSSVVYNNYVRQSILESVEEKLNESGAFENISNAVSQLTDTFPFLFSEESSIASLGNLKSENIAVYIADELIAPTALEIVKIILLLLFLLLFYLITGIIIRMIKKLRQRRQLPLHRTNSFLGGVFALLKCVVIVFAFAAIADTVLSFGYENNTFISQLKTSKIIELINDFNPLID